MYNILFYILLDTLYLENSNADSAAKNILEDHSGANVFIRNSKILQEVCKDPSYFINFENHCGYDIDEGGWKLVRHAPNQSTWHTSTDKLAGTDTYGTSSEGPESNSAWSVDFESTLPNFDELLLASGNCQHWAILNKQALTQGGNYNLRIYLLQ